MPANLLASILHLSDPHLGEDFDYPARLLQQLVGKANTPVTPRRLRAEVNKANAGRWLQLQTGPIVALPHDQTVLRAVFRGINSAQLQLYDRYDKFAGFDLVVVSGDILTEPFSVKSYDNFAHAWLTGTLTDNQGNRIGLNVPTDRIVAIPGNHDRFHQADDKIYGQSLIATQLPQSRSPVDPGQVRLPSYCARFTTATGIPLHFIGMDSNHYGDRSTLARGDVTDAHIDAIVNYSKGITDPRAFLLQPLA